MRWMTRQHPRTSDRIVVAPDPDSCGAETCTGGIDSACFTARDRIGVLYLAPIAAVERSTAANSMHVDATMCVA